MIPEARNRFRTIKTIHPALTRLAITLAGLAIATTSASAALVQTKVFSATELAYSGDVSTTDLLTGKTASSVSGWNLTNGSTVVELNDGIHGGTNTPVAGTWTTVDATATYNLGLGANSLGYDLSSIQTIAAWVNAGFGNQGYTVDIKLKDAVSFITLATVDHQPFNTSQGGATKVTLTDDAGVLASGVEFIRFTANRVNGISNSGAFVFRELDVFGSPTVAMDNTPPQISALAPLDNANGVLVGANLVATFSENISLGAGNIRIKNLDTSALTVIPVGDSQVSISGKILTVNPSANLAAGSNYAIQIDPTAIKDLANNPFAGISNETSWNFTTGVPDLTPPTIVSLSPLDNGINIPASTNLVLTFSENVALGSGNITIKNLSAATQTVIPVGDPQVLVSGAVLTINPTLDLAVLKNYAIQIDSGAITDLAANPFTGIVDDTAWNFTTKAPDAQEFSTTEIAYAADASTSDLLNGLTATSTTGWNNTNGAQLSELNDGIHGGTYSGSGSVAGAWTTVGATVEYNLGTGLSGTGYNITSIQSIAAWSGSGFGNQAWSVEGKPVGGSWTTLSTVNYQPLAASAGGATKVTLTDPGGVLASGIQFIRFTAIQVNGGLNAGAFVWRELDVFGVPTVDLAAPTVATLNPADNTTAVPTGANLVATFNESIAPGSGNITIKNLDTSDLTTIPIGDSQISITGAVLTINPSTNLAAGTNYAIQIDATAIKDLANNPFSGIATDTTWNFTTGVPDFSAPTIIIRSPVDNATNVPVATNLVLTFNENIARGSGNITIKNLSASTQTVIPVGDPQVSVSGAVLTINPTSDLAVLKNYAIRIDSGAIADLSGNPFTGIADDTNWNFTSASTPLRIMCLGDSITAGYTDNPTWANHPFKFGYRSGLYTRLTNAGYNFKFVGASAEPWSGINGDPTYGGTYTPALDLRTFAQDGHRGYGGASISAVNGNAASYISADTPDVILLLIGINGIGSGSPAALNTLVNTIVTAAPNARLIVAQITPRVSFNQSLYDYNLYIRDTLVPNYVSAGKKVSTVNLYSLFLTNPSDYSSAIAPNVLANGINHPDNPRYDLMAGEWFKGIEALGLGPNTFSRWIAGFPGVGALTGFNDDPDGDGNKNGLENFFGTSPSVFTTGVIAGTKSANTFTFTHPQNPTLASDVSAAYRWSKDLATFNATGATDLDGTSVTFVATPGTPAPGITTVTATVTGTPTARLFLRVEVMQN